MSRNGSRRGELARRSPGEWAVRGVFAAIALALGYYSVTFSLAQVLVEKDVALAHRLAPYDGRITALLAASLAGPEASAADRARADALARQALRQDPTAVSAIWTLGINAEARGDIAGARRLFAYSQKLSRRDLPTQIWAIEDAVRRGDIPGALRHYDIALRTSPEASDLLYPVLAAASGDPQIRAELIRTLAGKPMWGESFIGYIGGSGPEPQATAALFTGLTRAGVAVPEAARAGAVNALVAKGLAGEAWTYYAAIRPGADRRRSRDPGFSAGLDVPAVFDWAAINDGGVSTSIQRSGAGGVFDFSAPATTGGPLLRQMQMLPPGAYRLTGHGSGIEQEEGARPYWVLACQDGRELGRMTLPNSAQGGGNFSASFSVPSGCPMQVLTLVARPSEAIGGLSGQIDRVELAPAR